MTVLLDHSKGTVKVYLSTGRQSPRFAELQAALNWIRRVTG